MIREKFDTVVAALKDREDKDDFMDDVNAAITSCGRYIEAVNSMEAVLTVQRFRLDPQEFRECLQDADKHRRSLHNALIANITILDRICKMLEVPPVYGGDTESRLAVADFAMEVVKEMFDTRKL